MSTTPGLASKGEKGKQKFQSLDINHIYTSNKNESLETQQQKTFPRKHGMQLLGKVPATRKPPFLPSIKSELSGSNASVLIVPSGGSGWGKQDTTTAPSDTKTSAPPTSGPPAGATPAPGVPQPEVKPPQPTGPPAGPPVAGDKSWSAVMSAASHPPPYQSAQFQQEFPSLAGGPEGVAGVARGPADAQYGPGPSLRPQTEGSWIQGGGVGGPAPVKVSSGLPQVPPQLSGPVGHPGGPGAPQGGGVQQHITPQLKAVLPPFMCRGNFPMNGPGNTNFSSMTNPLSGRSRFPGPGGPPQYPEGRGPPPGARPGSGTGPPTTTEADELMHRPIIKEEDLNRMDDMTRDIGWASHDDIDYNQKLAFSDEEPAVDHSSNNIHHQHPNAHANVHQHIHQHPQPIKKEPEPPVLQPTVQAQVQPQPQPQQPPAGPPSQDVRTTVGPGPGRAWNTRAPPQPAPAPQRAPGPRMDEEEFWVQKRKQQSEEVAIAAARAKARKEEEEKRFRESREAANKKLLELEEKIKEKRGAEHKEVDDNQGTINPSAIPPQPIQPVPIPVPDWEKERESRERSRTPNDPPENPTVAVNSGISPAGPPVGPPAVAKPNDFRQLTQIEGRNLAKDREISRDRDGREQRNRHFLSNVPPRFLKQQQEGGAAYRRGNTSATPPPQHTQPQGGQGGQYDPRWKGAPQGAPARQHSDEYHGYRGINNRDYEFKREEKWDKTQDERKRIDDKSQVQSDPFDEHEMKRQDSGEWRKDERPREEAHRPESRPKDVDYSGNWADTPYEPAFEDKKKDLYREERRQVPGPITKEKIEADDLRSEKRHLTQLKHFNATQEKKDEKSEPKVEEAWRKKEPTNERNESGSPKAWADVCAPVSDKFMEALEKTNKKSTGGEALNKSDSKTDLKKEEKDNKDDKHLQNRPRNDRSERNDRNERSDRNERNDPSRAHRTWNSGYPAYHTGWGKRNEPRGGGGTGGGGGGRTSQRPPGHRRAGDWHLSDSEISGDEVSVSTESGKEDRMRMSQFQRSPKPVKKSEKDEKNKEYKQEKASAERKFDKRYEQGRNRESFVPRGEPSRHGRGGFRGGRTVTSKRSDGYGIPPSKSPFGNPQDEKDKKLSGDEFPSETNSDDKGKTQGAWQTGVRQAPKNDSRPQRNEKRDDSKGRAHSGSGRHKSKAKVHSSDAGEECWETTSENSDTGSERKDKNRRKPTAKTQAYPQGGSNRQAPQGAMQHPRMGMPPPRNQDKRMGGFGRSDPHPRQNSNGSLRSGHPNHKKDGKEGMIDGKKDSVEMNGEDVTEEKTQTDADGFQEVRSKKTVKDRQKTEDKPSRSNSKSDKDSSRGSKSKTPSMQLMPQQIAAIPPLLGTPMNPPMMSGNKNSYERLRQQNMPPRFVRQQRLMQQGMCDVSDMNKLREPPMTMGNAWDKPITSQLRAEQDMLMGAPPPGVESDPQEVIAQQSSASSQRSSPSADKGPKGGQRQDGKGVEGATPLVNTIIFENTNYKSTPVASNNDLSVKSKFNTHLKTQQRTDKTRGGKLDDADLDSVISNFNKPISEMLNKGDSKPDPIQMPLSFNKAEDNADMKLDFTFDSELSQLTEDKGSKSLGLQHSMHGITSGQSASLPSTAELNLKIASVKKVWENNQEDSVPNSAASFSASFGPDPNSLDHSAAFGGKGTDTPDDGHEGYSPSPSQSCTSNNTTNVCKLLGPQVKPTQQMAGGIASSGQPPHSGHHTAAAQAASHHQQHAAAAQVAAAQAQQQHAAAAAVQAQQQQQHGAVAAAAAAAAAQAQQSLMGHPLSPPPTMQQVLGAAVGLGQPGPQQYAGSQHINYQPNLGGSAQYGSMSAIPSPPTVLFNSTQQLPTQGGLYGAFQIDQSQVLNSQGRSQFSQYPYSLGQTASTPYNAQNMYLQTAPPHPPPSAQPPPDLYQSLSSQYRMATGPFGQSQQLTNNPSTVLIPSTSNSLMSASVKPSSQQISAIGTKAGSVGQAYQQQSQQGQQLYIPYDPNLQAANYLPGTGVIQRGHSGPVQNSVVPGMQSTSYYSGSGIGAQTGYYQQPGNSTLQSAPLHQHQTSFSLQGNVFGTHGQSHGNAAAAAAAGLQSFGSQFLSSPMPLQAATAALTAQQQYTNFFKNSHMGDQGGRSQQLKSPGTNQQDVLTNVFNSAFHLVAASQNPSPKSRQNCKQPPPQSSPTQHKYVFPYQSVNNQQSAQIPPIRCPAPIQRPVNFQPALNSLQGTGGASGQRHRTTHSQGGQRGGPQQQRQYYSGQGGSMQGSQSDKSDDGKLNENGTSISISGSGGSSNGVAKSGGVSSGQNSEMAKESGKEETTAAKE